MSNEYGVMGMSSGIMEESSERELLIKNMVCDRCCMVVRETLESLGLEVQSLELGKAVVKTDHTISTRQINESLGEYGFELIHDQNHQLIEQIKTLLIQYVQSLERSEEELPKVSTYLSGKLHHNYSSLSAVFSDHEEITIEKYLIHLKIERVKELLSYGRLTLSEIAAQLNYSSISYLSNQFRQITGMSVTDYKKASDSFRKPLDGI